MYEECPDCKLKYEREPGYFLGSAYINYALTALLLTSAYVGFRFIGGVSSRLLMGPLVVFCVLFPLAFFRHARSFWLAMDCFFDPAEFDSEQD